MAEKVPITTKGVEVLVDAAREVVSRGTTTTDRLNNLKEAIREGETALGKAQDRAKREDESPYIVDFGLGSGC